MFFDTIFIRIIAVSVFDSPTEILCIEAEKRRKNWSSKQMLDLGGNYRPGGAYIFCRKKLIGRGLVGQNELKFKLKPFLGSA